jgi:hypothetical protein
VPLRPYADIRRSGTVLGLNGDVGITHLEMTPKGGIGPANVTLEADRVVVHTPGLWWLVRSSLLGMPKEVPARFGFRLDGIHAEGNDSQARQDLASQNLLFPFDLAGCEPAMSPDVLRALGADGIKGSFEMTMTHPSDGQLRLDVNADKAGVAKVEIGMDIGLTGDKQAMQVATATVQDVRVIVTDQGLAASRNAYCEKKTGLSADAFLAAHVEAASTSFASRGLKPGAALTQAYAGFAKDGGSLTITARPLRPMPLAGLQGINLENIALYFDAKVRHDDDLAGSLAFLPADPGAIATAGAAPVTLAPAAVAPAASASAAALPAAPTIAVGREIPYDQLAAYTGADIEVSTTLGSVRRGSLLGATPIGLSLRLAKAEGGYSLSLSRETIAKILLVKPSAAAGTATNEKR